MFVVTCYLDRTGALGRAIHAYGLPLRVCQDVLQGCLVDVQECRIGMPLVHLLGC